MRGFDVRIDLFRVDRRPIPTKKYPDSLMSVYFVVGLFYSGLWKYWYICLDR